jgi:perosamine synthetase
MTNFIPVNEPLLNGREKEYVNECIETGWISSEGPAVHRFEQLFSARIGRQHGIAVCNGSVALDAGVAALGIGPGDRVIMPAFTIISCGAAIVRAGAIPILIDSDPLTWNMDLNHLDDKIKTEINKHGKRLKAIMVVHIYGLPVDMEPVLSAAEKYGLHVIEDAAEMHGQTYKGKPCGSFGDLSTFSFYPNKHITTGEGGMIVTDSPAIADKCRSLRNLCIDAERRYIHDDLGWNFRMSNIQAALGLAQLERLDEFVEKKRDMGKKYSNLLRNVPGILLPLPSTSYAENIYWVYGIVLQPEVSFDATFAMDQLKKRGIQTRHFFYPMNKQPVFIRRGLFTGESYPVAESLAERGFYIPSGLAITRKQQEDVAQAIKEIMS